MARSPDAYTKFDPVIAASDLSANPWVGDEFTCDYALLDRLLGVALSGDVDQATGDFARAFDCWAAVELRRAGFPEDQVWPRASMPRVLTRELSQLVESLTRSGSPTQSAELRAHIRDWLATHDRSPGIAPTEAKVLGGVYRKQADVLVADWSAGVELMISTKSMLGSYGKNLRNRFEESFGDAINLRQRFPLGAFGFLFVIDSAVPQNDFVFLKHMLSKLVGVTGYDATCLILVDLSTKGVDLASPAHNVPHGLRPATFFKALVSAVLSRTPASRHAEVRSRLGLETDEGEHAGI